MRRLAITVAVAAFALAAFACDGGDGDGGRVDGQGSPTQATTVTATATAAPTQTPAATASPSPQDEVITAYLHYWDVYADAVHNLDTSRLEEVMTGPRLERGLNEIQDLRDQGRAVDIVVENDPVVVQIEGDRAVVHDEYENRSYFIDPTTKEPLSSPEGSQTIRDTVTLTRVDQTWKVLDTLREASSP
jgi:hypothetical protein